MLPRCSRSEIVDAFSASCGKATSGNICPCWNKLIVCGYINLAAAALPESNALPTRYLDTLRSDPPVIASQQTCHRRSDVIRHSNAAKGGHGGKRFVVSRGIAHGAAKEVGLDRPRRDG